MIKSFTHKGDKITLRPRPLFGKRTRSKYIKDLANLSAETITTRERNAVKYLVNRNCRRCNQQLGNFILKGILFAFTCTFNISLKSDKCKRFISLLNFFWCRKNLKVNAERRIQLPLFSCTNFATQIPKDIHQPSYVLCPFEGSGTLIIHSFAVDRNLKADAWSAKARQHFPHWPSA